MLPDLPIKPVLPRMLDVHKLRTKSGRHDRRNVYPEPGERRFKIQLVVILEITNLEFVQVRPGDRDVTDRRVGSYLLRAGRDDVALEDRVADGAPILRS